MNFVLNSENEIIEICRLKKNYIYTDGIILSELNENPPFNSNKKLNKKEIKLIKFILPCDMSRIKLINLITKANNYQSDKNSIQQLSPFEALKILLKNEKNS